MANDFATQKARDVWQHQAVEPLKMSIDEIRVKARRHERMIRRRNAIEYFAVALVVTSFAYNIWHLHAALMRLGSGLCIAGAIYMAVQLHRRGSTKAVPAEMGLLSGIDFYRSELGRQRDLLRNSWSWYLGPLLPGLAVLVVGALIHSPNLSWRGIVFVVAYCVATALALLGIRRLHLKGVKYLQRQIDELNSLETKPS
jgi:hypothetical protein